MKNITINLVLLFLLMGIAYAQHVGPKITPNDKDLPQWVKLMYEDNPNFYVVEKAYKEYYETHTFKKNSYTQYYKRWSRYVRPYTDDKGNITLPTSQSINQEEKFRKEFRNRFNNNPKNDRSGNWEFAGPNEHYTTKYNIADPQESVSEQANIYTIDRCLANPNVLYCGAEEGGVYKSINAGATWELVTKDLYVGGTSAVCVHPINDKKAMFCSKGKIYKTTDAGATWTVTGNTTFQNTMIEAKELLYHPTDSNLVFAATEQGFYRSTDNGTNWTLILGQISQSVAINPSNSNIIYTLQYSPQDKIAYFYKSTDKGQTFSIKPNGWFSVPVADVGKITSYGGDIAVTQANPNKVYVLLVGESDATANLQLRGTIGVYMSTDAGENWTFPHGQLGMPYNVSTHPNLMDFDGQTSDYNQIYYNTTLICSQLNENNLLLGGLNLWRSNDGGASYSPVGGYMGSTARVHPDMQELRVFKMGTNSEEVWLSCDGGVNYSIDFFQTHVAKNFGLYAGGFWGFDQGWSEDVMIGGRYHNGNGGFYNDYPDKKFLSLGGGEAPTGYTNYNGERKVYASDISGVYLPETIDGAAETFAHNVQPNESYWENNSSRLTFDWNYWNVCFMGKDNKIYKSLNGGGSFSELYAFGTNTNDEVLWIEQAHSNTNVIYAQQVVGGVSKLWKTTDGGQTWTVIAQPQNYRNMVFSVSYTNENELWIAYQNATNGNKVYHTTNSGTNWTNLTTANLNGVHITGIAHQAKTDGGVYIMVKEAAVLYRNNAMPDWVLHGNNLPIVIDGLRIVPFYKENKLRLAAWNMSIWEIDLYETSALNADFSANYYDTYCPQDTIYFTDHSVASSNATYQWTFTGGMPATSTLKYPKVTYSTSGQYSITLKVTDGAQTSSITKNLFVSPGNSSYTSTTPLQEGFESGIFNPQWRPDTEGWTITSDAGGFGNSTKAMLFNNYDIDLGGGSAEVWTFKQAVTTFTTAKLKWDVAYVPYASNYQDSLEVLMSKDCGQTFTSLYLNGGSTMATGPANGNSAFIPTASQWRTDSVIINNLTIGDEIIFSFKDIGHWGQRLYVDNINLLPLNNISIDNPLLPSQVVVMPNPNNGQFELQLNDIGENATITITNLLGQTIYQQNLHLTTTNTNYSIQLKDKGMFLLKVNSDKGHSTQKMWVD